MEGMEIYLKMILREKEKLYESEASGEFTHKTMILNYQIRSLQEAIDKGPISSTEQMIKDVNWKLGKIDQRFEAIETFISENQTLKITEGGQSA